MHEHENSKDSEASLGIYDILNNADKGGKGSQISEVRTDNLPLLEEN